MTTSLRLESRWNAAGNGEPLRYEISIFNAGGAPVSDFSLCVSGPARIDPAAQIEGATLVNRLSNHAEIKPPAGLVLTPGAEWIIVFHGLSYPLRHWSDGTTTAYVALADGTTIPVAVQPTIAIGQNAPLRKGTQKYPVPGPGKAPVNLSIIPWPAGVAATGRATVPEGFAPAAESAAGAAAAAAFAELTGALFPAEGIVRPVAEGGRPVRLLEDWSLGPEAYRIGLGADISISAATATGFLYGLVTVGQIWRGARQHPETFIFPAEGEI